MSSDEMALRVLYEIRDGIRATNERVDGTNARLDAMSSRVDAMSSRLDDIGERVVRVDTRTERLGEQIVESEIRTATAVNETTFAIREVYKLLKERLRDIDEIKRRRE